MKKTVLFYIIISICLPFSFVLPGQAQDSKLSDISLLEHYSLIFKNENTPVTQRLQLVDTLLSLCQKLEETDRLLSYRREAAILYQQTGDCYRSYYHFQCLAMELESLRNRNNQQENWLRDAYISMTLDALQAGIFEEGFQAAYDFLEKFPQAPHDETARIYSNMGGMLMYEGKMEESYEFHQKALHHLHLANDSNANLVYNNYAGWFFTQGIIDSALHYLLLTKESVSHKSPQGGKDDSELYFHNLALIYYALGDKDIAYQYYKKALEATGEESSKSFRKAQILMNMGRAYLSDQRIKEAKNYLSKSIELAQRIGYKKIEAQSRLLLSSLLHQIGENDSAYQQLLISYYQRDTVLSQENSERTFQLRSNFEIKQIQQDLKLSELNILKKKLTIAILGIFTLLLGCFLVYILIRLQKERKFHRIQDISHQENHLRMNSDLAQRNRIILSSSVNNTHKDETLNRVRETIENLLASRKGDLDEETELQYKNILQDIHSCKTEDRWRLFLRNFEESYPHFFTLLQQENPQLTKGDKRLAALLASGMNAKEIAEMIHRTPNSVETFIYRLRKKLNIDKDTKTNLYFENLKDKSVQ